MKRADQMPYFPQELVQPKGIPDTFSAMCPDLAPKRRLLDRETPVADLNEHEYIDGEVWANIWIEDRVARVDLASGRVLGWIGLSELYPASRRSSDAVVNAIAYDPESERICVTGALAIS